MKKNIKEILGLLSLPLLLLFIYFILFIVWHAFHLPNFEEMTTLVTSFFDKYGLIVVFIGALIEGLLLLGQYFPGGFVIFLGVISAGKNVLRASEVVLIVCISFFISYFLNYLIGKYGWYKLLIKFGLKKSLERAQKRIKKNEASAIFLGYWEPDIATITATAAGILRIDVKKFLTYSLVSIIFWNILWGLLVFSLGVAALNLMKAKYVLPAVFIWIVIILIKYIWNRRKEKEIR